MFSSVGRAQDFPVTKVLISFVAGIGASIFFIAHSALGFAVFFLAIFSIIYTAINKSKDAPFSWRDGCWFIVMAALPLAYFFKMAPSDFEYRLLDKVVRLLLAVPIFWVVRSCGVSALALLVSVSIGVLFAGFESFVQISDGVGRVSGSSVSSPIPFGNFALLFGVLGSIVVFSGAALRASKWLKGLCLVGLIAGVFSSVASGTRGGWVAIPVFVLLFWKFFGPKNRPVSWRACVIGAVLVLGGATLIPGIGQRVDLGVTEVQHYFSRPGVWKSGDSIGSLDTRLDMWVAGIDAFRSAPWTGLGFSGFKEFLHHRIEAGLTHPDLETIGFKHLHCEIITTAAKLGLLGLLALATLWVGGVGWFLAGAKENESNGMIFRVMGLITFTAMITYSLTDSMFGMTLHAMVYTLFLGISAGGLRHAEIKPESRSDIV